MPPTPPTPRVCVLLPFHNAASTLARALDSLRLQTFPDWQLLAINDGSTDDSPALAAAAAGQDPRIHVLHQTHTGIVDALQRGLAHSRAPFVARMDADDEAMPERLEIQVRALEADPSLGLVGSRVEYAGTACPQGGYARHVEWLNRLLSHDTITLARFVESPFAHPSVVFRRDLVDRWGSYRNGAFPEDYELWLRWLDAGVRMAKVPETLLRWHDPPQRLSRTDPRYAVESFYQVKAEYLARDLSRRVSPNLPILAWGAGRLTRRRIGFFEAAGIRISGFLDIDPRKQRPRPDGRPVLAPESLPAPGRAFVLGCVANRGARDLQRAFLVERGYLEGRDFLFAA